MPRAVLLDLFDTVVASDWSAWHATLSRILGVDRRTLFQAYATTRVGRNTGRYRDEEGDMRAVVEAVGIEDPPPDLVRSCAAAHYDFTRNGIELYDDVVVTLAALRAAGVRTALISNCDHFARHVVDRLELRERFDAVILSYEVGAKKPSPEIYAAALAAVGDVTPGDAVFVDDQTSYCDGARDTGIDTRLIVRPDVAPPEGVSIDANGHAVIADLSSLRPA
ncbi:MAG TPA: HAD-IA family hydrolase [Actinomycetota bacterium]|nr:HAD-IA family hydrolase [Actinomycetota bacterium]